MAHELMLLLHMLKFLEYDLIVFDPLPVLDLLDISVELVLHELEIFLYHRMLDLSRNLDGIRNQRTI